MRPGRPDMAPWQERLLMLNRRQTRALIMGILTFLFMGLFPPWERSYVNELGGWFDRPAGFHFILAPPDVSSLSSNYVGSTLNWTQLFIQWMVGGVITLGYMWRFRDSLNDQAAPRFRPPSNHR